MRKRLLKKLAEEAGEVVVAAIKHLLHNTTATASALEDEIGDLIGVYQALALDCNCLDPGSVGAQAAFRRKKELARKK